MFHCQQAAKKALKALLTWHDQPFKKTHDLTALGSQCKRIDESLSALLEFYAEPSRRLIRASAALSELTDGGEVLRSIAALVADSYGWFKTLVKERRKLDDAGLAAVSDGRVFTGRQGLGLHLVDGLGEEREAIQYLETSRGIAKNLPVVDWKKSTPFARFGLFSAVAGTARVLGLLAFADVIEQASRLMEGKSLDGLLAIWQAQNDKPFLIYR